MLPSRFVSTARSSSRETTLPLTPFLASFFFISGIHSRVTTVAVFRLLNRSKHQNAKKSCHPSPAVGMEGARTPPAIATRVPGTVVGLAGGLTTPPMATKILKEGQISDVNQRRVNEKEHNG